MALPGLGHEIKPQPGQHVGTVLLLSSYFEAPGSAAFVPDLTAMPGHMVGRDRGDGLGWRAALCHSQFNLAVGDFAGLGGRFDRGSAEPKNRKGAV